MGLIDGIIEKDNQKSAYVMYRYRDSALKAQRAIEDGDLEELRGYTVKITSTTKTQKKEAKTKFK
jgi:hypothetical protein